MDPLLSGTLGYVGVFVIGIYLARQQRQISRYYASLSQSAKILMAVSSVLLFIYARTAVPVAMSKLTGRSFGFLAEWLSVLGGAGIVVFSLNSKYCRGVLLSGVVRFLGRVSYSMYLVHGTILFSLVHLLFGRIPLLAIFPMYIVIVLVASAIFYRTIEKPSMEWGRRASNQLIAAKESSRLASRTAVRSEER